MSRLACGKLSFLFLFILNVNLSAQPDPDPGIAAGPDTGRRCGLRISLLTASSGSELYSAWGHSALRVIDSTTSTDITYNYGTFDVYDPDFYWKFTRGTLLYCLSRNNFSEFLPEYLSEKRSVYEQVLQLNCEEKIAMQLALEKNNQEENRCYHYDFASDNCTTRIRDLIRAIKGRTQQIKRIIPEDGTTVRRMIHDDLDRLQMYWTRFGIDLLLGSRIDRKLNNFEAQFLPASLEKALDSTSAQGLPLVAAKIAVYEAPPVLNPDPVTLTPTTFTAGLLLLMVVLAFIRTNWAQAARNVFDFLLFFITGLVGVFLLFMWFGTDHVACRDNYNLLWAFPPHFIAAFLIHSTKRTMKIYWQLSFVVYILLLLTWFLLPQQLNPALLPLLVLLAWRSRYRSARIMN